MRNNSTDSVPTSAEPTEGADVATPDALTAPQLLARTALLEITPESTIGAAAGQIDEGDGVVSYLFENEMSGYPGWKWTVTVATVEGAEPTVLETELTPAEGALLAPEWVPWEDRMDEQRAAASADADDDESDDDADDDDEESDEDDSDDAEDEDDDNDDDDDSDDDDDEDEDDDVRPVLHAGDLDGVDIDELDETNADSDDDESDDDESDDGTDENTGAAAEASTSATAFIAVPFNADQAEAVAELTGTGSTGAVSTEAVSAEDEPAELEIVIVEDTTAEVDAPVAEVFVAEVPVVDTAVAEVLADEAPVVEAPAAEVEDPRYAEPVADITRAPRRSRRASSASIAPKAE